MTKTYYYKDVLRFINSMHSFPHSLENTPFEYNTGALIKILQKKEVLQVCHADETSFAMVNAADIELGKVVTALIRGEHPEKSLNDYHVLEKKIGDDFDDNLYLYAKQGALSVKSLYYYKMKDFSKAITYTLECIVLNDYLVQQGIHSLNLRCFEQNKNISRIYFREGKWKQGYSLIKNLLNYLLTGNSIGLFGNIFKNPSYWSNVPIVREIYAYELFVMIAEDMIRFNINNQDYFLPDAWYQDLDFDVNTPDRQIIYNWIYINKQLRSENYTEYFDSLIYYFSQPESYFYEILRVCLLIDLFKLIRKNQSPGLQSIAKEMVAFIENKLISNTSLRESVIKNIFKFQS